MKQGDRSVITHVSEHVTVIDVSNVKTESDLTVLEETVSKRLSRIEKAATGNVHQKEYPVNPNVFETTRYHGTGSVQFLLTD